MGRDLQQVKKAFMISALILLFVMLTIAWIPFLLYSINPNLESSNLLAYIIDNYTYTGLKGLMIIGITAMAMSTADSYINASAVLFSNDFCKPLRIAKNQDLILSKIFALTLGIGAIILSLSTKDLLSIILLGNSFYFPIVTPIIFLTILGFRTSTKSVLIGMLAGLVTVIIWSVTHTKVDAVLHIFSIIVNLVFFIGSHYLLRQPGGWIGTKDMTSVDNPKMKNNEVKIGVLDKIKEFDIILFFKKNSPTDDLTYVGFGVYGIFAYRPGDTILAMRKVKNGAGIQVCENSVRSKLPTPSVSQVRLSKVFKIVSSVPAPRALCVIPITDKIRIRTKLSNLARIFQKKLKNLIKIMRKNTGGIIRCPIRFICLILPVSHINSIV